MTQTDRSTSSNKNNRNAREALPRFGPVIGLGALALALFVFAPGCASTSKSGGAGDGSADGANSVGRSNSSVDIAYVLGHNERRFHAESKPEGVQAEAFLDKQLVEAGTIDRDHYVGFLQKVATFVDASQKTSPDHALCRNPFTVTVRIGEDTRVVRGCRSPDEGALSHLVRDGEFLLSSKQN